jgi:PAS domain S-box-containing protein
LIYAIDSTLKQDLFCKTLASFPQALCIVDEECHFVFANEEFFRVPIASEDLLGKHFCDIFLCIDEQKILHTIEKALSTDESQSIADLQHVKNDGESSWWYITFQPIISHNDKKFLTITIVDVTEKYKSKKELAERTYEMEQIIQSISDPLIVFNEKMQKVYTNRAFQFLTAGSDQNTATIDVLNQLYEFYDFKGKKLQTRELPVEKALRGEFIHNYELQFLRRSDQVNEYYYVSTNPIHMKVSDQKLFAMVMRDVSKDLRQERNRKDFIQIAAHELRTPLTAIKGFTQLVLERYREREKKWFFQPTVNLISEIERDQTFFKVILDEANRLDQLTNELLSVFKIDQGKFEMDYLETNFSHIAKEAIEEFVIPDDSHHIHFSDQTAGVHVKIDTKQVKRVIQNLLSNAIKYSPEAPDIYASITQKGDKLIFSIEDEGIGIPEDQQTRIFERFFRAYSSSHETIHGYGVGLHICQEIIQQHDGKINFKSTFGKGSTFYFELPIIKNYNLDV